MPVSSSHFTILFLAKIIRTKTLYDFPFQLQLCRDVIHRGSKNVSPLTCYNVDIHGPTAAALSTNTAIVWKMWFSCFPVLPGSAEAQVIWGGILKHLLIAYFIGNTFLPKNIKICSRVSSHRWDVFLRHGICNILIVPEFIWSRFERKLGLFCWQWMWCVTSRCGAASRVNENPSDSHAFYGCPAVNRIGPVSK